MKPFDRLLAARDKTERLVLGLSSGTSADGIDAALVRIRGGGLDLRVEPVAGCTRPWPEAIRELVLGLGAAHTSDVCRMNFRLGEMFAEAALDLIREAGLEPEDVDLIGSHGQTVYHVPRGVRTPPSTLQIGEPDVIAEKTRIPVIADFRTRDVAAGGEGAPLVPYVDYLLFRREDGAVAMQNIGGIANVTLVTPALEDVIAFDTGPGNMPLDHLVRVLTRGAETFDRGGKHAVRGRIDEILLDKLLRHPYFMKPPPKSTGRETFGADWVMQVLAGKGNDSILDVLATMTLAVAKSIARAYEEWVFPRAPVREVVLSGGGAANLTLVAHLRRLLAPVPVTNLAAKGWDPDLKEAVAFAVLASESLTGNPDNVPSATGASWPVVLGKICP